MEAIGLNPIRLGRIGLDPIRINAIKLGVPGASGSDRPYIDPEVLASLKAVCICYGKSNDDPDRAIVKNLVDPDNPFVISNAAFKLNSGFGKYSADFESFDWAVNISQKQHNKATISLNGRLCNHAAIEVDEMKVNIIGNVTELIYWYIANPDDTTRSEIRLTSGINTLPKSYAKDDGQTYNIGFAYISGDSEITIEQIPSFQGAFVTDGIDDLIKSTKSATEMLDGSNEVTVVSMIHQIKTNSDVTRNNWFFTPVSYLENRVVKDKIGKTGIYGYTSTNVTNAQISDITPILGDKNDYTLYSKIEDGDRDYFTVEGFQNQGIWYVSSIAWYWTIIANKVLTTDQINQVIAYFNLDRTLKSDIYCNIAKQGITNENHAEFGDKLIDFSGNGRDIQMYNLAWGGNSGIGNYATNFNDWQKYDNSNINNNSYSLTVTGYFERSWLIWSLSKVPVLKVKISRIAPKGIVYYTYPDNGSYKSIELKKDGIYTLPAVEDNSRDIGFRVNDNALDWIGLTITQIPSHAGALCLDGVNDFGKVTGMPIYKDYTFIIEREFLNETFPNQACLASKSKIAEEGENGGAFIVDNISINSIINPYSFYKTTSLPNLNTFDRQIVFQSKYKYLDKDIVAGTATDSDTLWLGTFRDNDSRFANVAIYSLMSFPYSMSEFLIERQLKKHKLGTLYPNMVEFRPIVPKDDRIESISYYNENDRAYVGNYYSIGSNTSISFKMVKPYKITNIKVNGANTVYNHNNGFNFKMPSKSPQKFTNLNIVVDTSIILFNPTINSNAIFEVGNEETMPELFTQLNNGEIDGIILYMQGDKAVLPNNWIDKNTKVRAIIYCLDTVSQENIHFTVDGKTKYCYSEIEDGLAAFLIMDEDSQEEQYMTNVLTANTIDIQLDQYIRYEDIVQPYPVLLRFNDENGNEVSWGGKFKVGSTITRIGSFYENNLLDGLYIVRNPRLNGNNLITPTHVVEKSMVFTCDTEYLLDNNEPSCILSPRLLRIPNSSYKILGYIPDISGHGNHGVIHNSAYAKGSGVNEDGSYQFDGVNDFVTIPTLSSGGKQVLMKVNWHGADDEVLYDQRNSNIQGNYDLAISTYPDTIAYNFRNEGGKTFIDGILNSHIITNNLKNITHNISSINGYNNDNNSTICIGKSVFNGAFAQMALYDFMLFDNISTDDKIKELNEYVGIEAKVELPPYYWDNYGKTNLDEDKNYTANLGTVKDVIEVSQPAIFAENWYDGNPEPVLFSPIINQTDYSIEVKANKMDNNFTMMLDVECDTPLPAFKAKFSMVGTAISVDLKYYINGGSKIIDVFKSGGSTEPVILDIPASERSFIYGTNTDNYPNILIEVLPADNGTRYGLTNTNFAYDKMSGYGGYEFAKFDNTSEWIYTNNSDTIEVVNRDGYAVVLRKVGNGTNYWHFRNTIIKSLGQDIQIGVYANKSVQIVWQLKYKLEGETDYNTLAIASPTIEGNINTYVTLPYKTEQEIADLNAVDTYYSIYFIPIDLDINEEVTIEMLPLYPNGLLYDGVTDYSENANIPALTDYTYVFKRELLNLDKVGGGASLYKGSFYSNGGRAFIVDINDKNPNSEMSGYSYGNRASTSTLKTNKIIYGTKTSVNGVSVTPGSNTDNASLTLGKWDVNYKQMVFYKLILYPKTIPLLQINFLKNMMERDEIIDLNNPIFIQE